jgi:Hydrogenase/urease nickel incorporation, metallochaperone, hypA
LSGAVRRAVITPNPVPLPTGEGQGEGPDLDGFMTYRDERLRESEPMHELAVARSIVEMVEKVAEGRKVHRISVEIGRESCVSPDALSFCFELVAAGGAAEGAALDIARLDGDALNLKSLELEEAA